MTPKSRDHMPTMSLWGVTAKWPTRAPKTKLILCPRDPQGYSRISLSLSGRILKEYRNIVSAAVFHGVCEIATQMGAMRRSKKVSSFELYKLNPLSPHSLRVDCAGARALLYLRSSANCYSSQQHNRPAQSTFLSTTCIYS